MPAGRPTKFTAETRKKLTDALRLGATRRLACAYAGISEETLSRWQDDNVDFVKELKEAEGAASVQWLAKIEKAASDGNWQAAAWKLERLFPDEYGRKYRLEHSGKVGVDVSKMSDDELERIARGDES